MKEKPFYSDTFSLTPGDFDQYLRLKPYSIFNLFQVVASHASTINQENDLQDHSWRLIRGKYIILKQPTLGEKVLVETRALPTHKFEYRREFKIIGADNDLLVRGQSIWCIDDVAGKVLTEDILNDDEQDGDFAFNPDPKQLPAFKHQVRASDLDFFLRLNAARYGEIILDAMNLPKNEFIKQIQINFINPAVAEEIISVYKANIENKYFLIGTAGDKSIFKAFVKTNYE
ncbi:MAG TPA: acyl-ACP thioesterase domain-containing protein [Bacilli bacterium]